jgi:hypothetical protein
MIYGNVIGVVVGSVTPKGLTTSSHLFAMIAR